MQTFTIDQLRNAAATLEELVIFETGKPAEKVDWSLDSVVADLELIITGDAQMQRCIDEMHKAKASLF